MAFGSGMEKVLMNAGLQALRSSKMVSPSLCDQLADLASGDFSDLKIEEHAPHTTPPHDTDLTRIRATKGGQTVTFLLWRE